MTMKTHFACAAAFSILATILAMCWAVPLSLEDDEVGNDEVENGDLIDDYLEDDMIIAILRNGQRAPTKRWPNANVYYKISSDYDDSQLASIKSAMAAIEAVTCVRFYGAKKNRKAYMNIKSESTGCTSAVGYQGRPQAFNLQKNVTKCFLVPVIMHELLHTLGFYHQHNAPDRDEYVTIVWDNIQPGKERWFSKFSNKIVTDFGFGYDYESIMHYAAKAFSVNGLATILPLDTKVRIGQRQGLSAKDIGKINAMYRCGR